MANTKISALPNAAALGGTEQIPGVQSAADVKLTPNQIASFLGFSGGILSSANGGTGVSTTAAYARALLASGYFPLSGFGGL